MKIDKVIIKNFRCFEQLEVTFHPQMTVLIAPNGAGKTTILDAVRIAMWPFVKGFDLGSQTGKAATIQIDDVRLRRFDQNMEPALPAEIEAFSNSEMNILPISWLQSRDKIAPRTTTKGDTFTTQLTNIAKKYQSIIYKSSKSTKIASESFSQSVENINLPLIVYLGTGRLWYQGRYSSEAQDQKLDNSVYSRFWGYQNCLTATSSYKQFQSWYSWVYRSHRELQITQLEGQLKPQDEEAQRNFSAAIKVVQTSINKLTQKLTGWHDLQYRASMGQQLVMEHPEQGYIPLSLLSDGLRNMVAMISDIAFRCIKLNPHLGEKAAIETSGIVLIDEVDMFLHPTWQQRVLSSLMEAFPKLQFIVTTHSPQVISTVHSDSIRVIGENYKGKLIASKPLAHTYGNPSNQVLESVMLVDPQPPIKEKEMLEQLTELVDQGKGNTELAQSLLTELTALLGDTHPQLQRLHRSLNRQQCLSHLEGRK